MCVHSILHAWSHLEFSLLFLLKEWCLFIFNISWPLTPSKNPQIATSTLVGGFNPFEKYARQNGFIFPKDRGENSKNMWVTTTGRTSQPAPQNPSGHHFQDDSCRPWIAPHSSSRPLAPLPYLLPSHGKIQHGKWDGYLGFFSLKSQDFDKKMAPLWLLKAGGYHRVTRWCYSTQVSTPKHTFSLPEHSMLQTSVFFVASMGGQSLPDVENVYTIQNGHLFRSAELTQIWMLCWGRGERTQWFCTTAQVYASMRLYSMHTASEHLRPDGESWQKWVQRSRAMHCTLMILFIRCHKCLHM